MFNSCHAPIRVPMGPSRVPVVSHRVPLKKILDLSRGVSVCFLPCLWRVGHRYGNHQECRDRAAIKISRMFLDFNIKTFWQWLDVFLVTRWISQTLEFYFCVFWRGTCSRQGQFGPIAADKYTGCLQPTTSHKYRVR